MTNQKSQVQVVLWRLTVAALGVMLSACSHVSTRTEAVNACKSIDWWEVGRTDGVTGAPLEKSFTEANLRCADSGFPVDRELFENGHEAGLVDYCTPSQGLAVGRSGLNYEKACPSYLEVDFQKQVELGRKLRELEIEKSDLGSRIQNLVKLLSKTSTGTALRAQIDELKQKRSALDLQMSQLESSSTARENLFDESIRVF